MAYVALTPVTSTRSGAVLPGSAVTLQNSFTNTEKEVVVIKNGSGAPITVTLKIVATVDGITVADPTVTINNGVTKVLGPFPKAIYNQTDGTVHFDVSATTSITADVIKLGTLAY